MNYFWLHLRREFILSFRQPAHIINPLIFFILTIALFPLALNPEPRILSQMAPAIIWVITTLSVLLSLNSVFAQDYENGVLEQVMLSPYSLSAAIAAKAFAHWLFSSLPIIALSPIIANVLFIDHISVLIGLLFLTTPTLILVGMIGASLTVVLKRASVLMMLLILPLYTPILIFAADALASAQTGMAISGHIYLLASLLVLSVALLPFVISATLKVAIRYQ